MRPAGEIRRLALHAFDQVALERQHAAVRGATWRDVVERLRPLGVAADTARFTVWNLARAGAIAPVGQVRLLGVARPLTLYVSAAPQPGGDTLRGVASAWVRRP